MKYNGKAFNEGDFLREKYPRLWSMYDEKDGVIYIPEVNFNNSDVVKKESYEILKERFFDKRYVMYRDIVPGEGLKPGWGYVVCLASIV